MAEKKSTQVQASSIIPQDVIDQAEQCGMDLEVLAKLCVEHTVEAARGWLSWISSKLPQKK